MMIGAATFKGALERLGQPRDASASPSLLARYGAPTISIAILSAAVFELYAMDWHKVAAIIPHTPWFWLVFAIFYLVPAVAEWCIYREIWGIPKSAILTMMRKIVSNDLLIGYAGETYLYTWARRAGRMPSAAFGAVKDVSILSAAVGNSATIIPALLTAPLLSRLDLHMPIWAMTFSLVAIMAPPMVAIFGRKRLFHLPGALLVRITVIHTVRSVSGILLTALLWHLALPELALSWWVVLSALKLLISRLPLTSNKELVFAGIIAMLFGHHGDIPALMAMMATLTLAAHIVAGLTVSTGSAIEAIGKRLVSQDVARGQVLSAALANPSA